MHYLALALVATVVAGCNSSPGDLRTWRPEDHDHTANPGQDQVVSGPDAGPSPELARVGLDEVTVIAWQQNCTRCHGQIGRGDGPQGPMLRATDLTNAAWQRSVTDEQIALVIQKGRGQMPGFPLPESTVKSLVRLVRLLDVSKIPEHGGQAGPADSAAATPSPAPARSVAPAPSAAPVRSAVPATSSPPRPVSSAQ